MTELLRRYRAGECEAVWAEMVALGPRVREPPYASDALAVAEETMRRARANIERIIERLDHLGYRFWDGVQGPRRGPPRALTFGAKRLEVENPQMLLAAMFEEARRLPAGALTSVMVEQLHNIYRTAVWPWQDTERLVHGERHPADAAAVTLFEQAKKTPTAQLAQDLLLRLERLTGAAMTELHGAWAEREARRPQPVVDHREDKKVLIPPRKKDAALIQRLAKRGLFLPLSLSAWIQQVGSVNLAGNHPCLCFWEDHAFSGVFADPLMLAVDMAELQAWLDEPQAEKLDIVIGWDARMKARLTVEDRELDDGYVVTLPAAGADAPLAGTSPPMSLVDYLRLAFRWGGFPGWAQHPEPPERELAFLTEGLMPI